MGAWGTALYSNDFALDLRTTIRALARLPLEGEELLRLLRQTEAAASADPADPDHTIFWLVAADQFAKRGIACASARDRALAIIDGEDIATMERLGMTRADLVRRSKMLSELRIRLAAPAAAKSRSVMKKPQAFVMEIGDAFAYPTSRGRCINPYYPSKDRIPDWKQDGWAALIIVGRGRAFDFLAWYRPLAISAALAQKPDLAVLRAQQRWVLGRPGTCSPAHFKKMELEKIANLPIDAGKLGQAFPAMPDGKPYAVQDISIANGLFPVAPIAAPGERAKRGPGRPFPTIAGLEGILGG
jgi:hypothetical protein